MYKHNAELTPACLTAAQLCCCLALRTQPQGPGGQPLPPSPLPPPRCSRMAQAFLPLGLPPAHPQLPSPRDWHNSPFSLA